MSEEYQLSLNPDYYVVMANDLIKGKQKMTLREAQLLYVAMAQVVKEDKDLKTYTTTIPDLAAFMGVPSEDLYKDIQSICKSLLQRVVEIQTTGELAKRPKWEVFQWVNYARYDKGKLTLRLSDDIKPYLVDLVSHYTQTQLGALCSFRSYYATRLYQLLSCDLGASYGANYRYNGAKEEWEFTCEKLRELYALKPKQYAQNRDLLRYTLIPAIEGVDSSDYAHIWGYEELTEKSKRGRPTLVGVRFKALLFKNAEEKQLFLEDTLPKLVAYGQMTQEECDSYFVKGWRRSEQPQTV